MQHISYQNSECLVLPADSQVIASLTELCKTKDIHAGYLHGIGAVSNVTCGWYDLATRSYMFTDYKGLFEVVSLQGNITHKEDEHFIHLHGIFTDTDNRAFGGHVKEMTVGITLEIFLHPLPGVTRRSYDERSGLYLIDPANSTNGQ